MHLWEMSKYKIACMPRTGALRHSSRSYGVQSDANRKLKNLKHNQNATKMITHVAPLHLTNNFIETRVNTKGSTQHHTESYLCYICNTCSCSIFVRGNDKVNLDVMFAPL